MFPKVIKMLIYHLNHDWSDIKDHFPNQKLTLLPMRDLLCTFFSVKTYLPCVPNCSLVSVVLDFHF